MAQFEFTSENLTSILKGAGIAALGAVLTYLTEYVSGADFGAYTATIVAGWSILVNVIRKYITA